MQDKRRIRQRANRYGFTINNPFITDCVKVLDPNNLTAEQQELLKNDKHEYSHLKTPDNEKYFDFAIVEYMVNEVKDKPKTAKIIIAERIFFKSYEMAKAYFKTIPFIDYFCFQYEKGADTGNLHLQGYMHFDRPMDMSTVHKLFPTSHLDICYGSNQDCIDYCSKSKTKIDGYDFVSYGEQPSEEGQRVDFAKIIQAIENNVPYSELVRQYPFQMMMYGDKFEKMRQKLLQDKYKNTIRNVYVTYIYGKENTGKTTFVNRVLGYMPMEVCFVGEYGTSGKFDEYENQDIIVFDEFDGQIPITTMNDYLNGQPRYLSARFHNKVACFTKAFIISNYPLANQYKTERAKGKEPSYKGFVRRINEIIYMPEQNHYIWQKGQPTAEIISKLTEQGATYKIIPQQTEQTKIWRSADTRLSPCMEVR